MPIVPGAIMFDLLNGGDKNWGRYPPYRELGYDAAKNAGADFALGSVGAGLGATTVNLKGGIGSASAHDARRHHRRRARGRQRRRHVTDRRRSAFLGGAVRAEQRIRRPRLAGFHRRGRSDVPQQRRARQQNTTLGVVATDAKLSKAQCNRLAVMAQDGLAARHLPGAYAARRRHGICGGDGRQSAPRSGLLPQRARHGWPPMSWHAPSPAASTRQPPCPSPARYRVGATNSAEPMAALRVSRSAGGGDAIDRHRRY